MQEDLYPLTSKDIEAISRSRTNRNIPKTMKYWLYASLAVCLIGLYYAYIKDLMVGVGIMVVGCVILMVYSNKVDKIRKVMVKRLKRENREKLQSETIKERHQD